MHRFIRLICLGCSFVICTPVFAADQVTEREDCPGPGCPARGSLLDGASADDDLSTLVTAVNAAGLVETLQADGPFTVFAPDNDAFAALPEGTLDGLLADADALSSILQYHILPAKLSLDEIRSQIEAANGRLNLPTIAGGELTAVLREGDVVLVDGQENERRVTASEIETSNGTLLVIDGVLLP